MALKTVLLFFVLLTACGNPTAPVNPIQVPSRFERPGVYKPEPVPPPMEFTRDSNQTDSRNEREN